ncbi:MAG: hypothetical protein B7Z81_01855 [Acidocella sp. 20-61-6]|nr:MAG: hypothetical protein B7Z81_01855 [Acidocella sp. 20-61-6]
MKKRTLGAAGFFLLALAAWLVLRPRTPPPPIAAPSVMVQTMTLKLATLPNDVEAEGSIIAGPGARQILLPAPGIVGSLAIAAGAHVAKGQVLAKIAPDPQAVADLQKARDALAAAQAGLAHAQALLASRLATNADLAAARQAENDATAQLGALQQTGAGRSYALKAPEAGVITALNIQPGAAAPAGTVLFTLADDAQPAALLGVPLAAAAAIAPGAPVSLTLLDENHTLNAAVGGRAAQLDPQTGLIDVTLTLNGAAPIGEAVRADIKAGTLTGYAVPRDAVQTDEDGDYIFQQGQDGLAHRVTVTVLGASGGDLVLAPPLNAALALITTGAYQLSDGMATRTQEIN